MSSRSKLNLVDEFGRHNETLIVKEIASGTNGKLNGDNVDIFVRTNDIRMSNKNRDYHFFATDWTPFRLLAEDMNNPAVTTLLEQERKSVTPALFQVNKEEIKVFKDNFKYLIGKIVKENIPAFRWLKTILPDHLHHDLTEIMSRKSAGHPLPILLKNEAKYADCVDILDAYESHLVNWYRKAGRGLK